MLTYLIFFVCIRALNKTFILLFYISPKFPNINIPILKIVGKIMYYFIL